MEEVIKILKEIRDEPKGAYRIDKLEYAHNVIQWCRDRAKEALDIIEMKRGTF